MHIVSRPGRAPAPVTALRTLPRDAAAFTGRQTEVDRLLTAGGQSGAVTIHTVDGMPGVGKTALVIHVARRLADHYPDGQIILRLHAHTPGQRRADPAEVLAALLLGIGIEPGQIPEDMDARAALWRDRLAGKRMLLVLDDAADHTQVEPLLPGGEGCLVLITSRRRLVALDGAVPLSLGTLPPGDAALLFSRLARRTPGSPADAAAVAWIVELCGRLPLAIALLAGRFAHHPHWNLTEYAREFAAARDRLGELTAGDRAVRAAFDMSYQALTDGRQLLFRRLGLHPGPDLDAYAAAALADLPLRPARTELEALYNDHLIDSPSPGRYRLHDLVRSYAQALSAEQEPAHDHDRALARLLDFYQHTARRADGHLADALRPAAPAPGAAPADAPALATHQEALIWVGAERANLIACIHHAYTTGRQARALGLTASLAAFLLQQGPWDAGITLLRNAAAAAHRTGDGLSEANALWELSRVHYLTGNYAVAADLAKQTLRLYRALDNRLGEANSLWALSWAWYLTGDYTETADLAQQTLRLYRALDNRLGEAGALWVLSWAVAGTGDYPAAAGLAEETLSVCRDCGHRLGEAGALWALGQARYMAGEYPEAAELLRETLGICRDLGHLPGEAFALWELGRVQCLTGNHTEAAGLTQQALDICFAIGHRHGQAQALQVLGRVRHLTGDYWAALDAAQQALDICLLTGHRHGQAHALHDLGRARTMTGDHHTAADLLQRSLALFQRVRYAHGQAEVLNSIGDLLRSSGKPHDSLAAYEQALCLARQTHSPLEEARALEGAARCRAGTGRRQAALAGLREAVDLYRRIGAAGTTTAARYLAVLEAGP
ncbi:ATP-binding protein [Streptomyces aidingensis]|nr:tetratricopeptide repeat protein [Streptomyces aidingensis]